MKEKHHYRNASNTIYNIISGLVQQSAKHLDCLVFEKMKMANNFSKIKLKQRCYSCLPGLNYLQPSSSSVAMYREPSLHDVAEQSPPRKTPKTSSDSPVLQNGKKDPQSKTKTSSS